MSVYVCVCGWVMRMKEVWKAVLEYHHKRAGYEGRVGAGVGDTNLTLHYDHGCLCHTPPHARAPSLTPHKRRHLRRPNMCVHTDLPSFTFTFSSTSTSTYFLNQEHILRPVTHIYWGA